MHVRPAVIAGGKSLAWSPGSFPRKGGGQTWLESVEQPECEATGIRKEKKL